MSWTIFGYFLGVFLVAVTLSGFLRMRSYGIHQPDWLAVFLMWLLGIYLLGERPFLILMAGAIGFVWAGIGWLADMMREKKHKGNSLS